MKRPPTYGKAPAPWRQAGEVATEAVADLRFRRRVQQVHRLGARAVGELLAEISIECGIRTVVDRKLDRYAELNPEALRATGGDDFWQPPLHVVPRT